MGKSRLLGLSVALALVISACASGQSRAPAPRESAPAAPLPPLAGAAPRVYVSEGSLYDGINQLRLKPIDARTLGDLDAPPLTIAGYPSVSGDGSTIAVIQHSAKPAFGAAGPRVTISVLDARSGSQRVEFPAPAGSGVLGLSGDGSRLVVGGYSEPSVRPSWTEWQTVDSHNGRVLGTIRTEEVCCAHELIDPAGRWLVRVLTPGAAFESVGPRHPMVVKYDLVGGTEISRKTLDSVLAGLWKGERKVGGEPLIKTQGIGVALSPDGDHLAVLHADGAKLTLVDLERMAVLSTRTLGRQKAVSLSFPLLPRPAYAKMVEGTEWRIVFAPDGRRLLATGDELKVDKSERPSSHPLGLRLLDAERAMIMAEAFKGQGLGQVTPSADGGIYLFGPSSPLAGPQAPWRLRRVDAGTLAVTAEREFSGPRILLVVPAAVSSRLRFPGGDLRRRGPWESWRALRCSRPPPG